MSVTGSNVLSTKDEIAAALAEDGMRVFAVHGAQEDQYFDHIRKTLSDGPNIIIDDGGDLVSMIHREMPELIENVWGGCEETTTGVIRLKAMEKDGVLKFPMVASFRQPLWHRTVCLGFHHAQYESYRGFQDCCGGRLRLVRQGGRYESGFSGSESDRNGSGSGESHRSQDGRL